MIRPPSPSTIARSTALRSSRTLPGQAMRAAGSASARARAGRRAAAPRRSPRGSARRAAGCPRGARAAAGAATRGRSAGSRGPRGSARAIPPRRSRLVAAIDAHVDRTRPAAADALELALLEDAQQLRLERRGISPISSRKSVPPCGLLERARSCCAIAPVNEPFSWPNSSDSRSSSRERRAVQRHERAGARRALARPAAATISLPVPDSPVTRTVVSDEATRPT